jgi:hypothetical protein
VSTTDADGVEDAVKGTLRVVMAAAARAGEHLAAMRAQELRRVAHEGERAAEELRARHEAHRQAARAVLQDVHRADWWATATAADIGRMYREATSWARVDQEAARAAERILTEVSGRYGAETRTPVELAAQRASLDEAVAAGEQLRNPNVHEEVILARITAEKGAPGALGGAFPTAVRTGRPSRTRRSRTREMGGR